MSNESLNKAIRSLAFIKVSWDQNKEDYIDSFIPFFATLMVKKSYTSIGTDTKQITTMVNEFKEEFGLLISYHALISIVEQAKKLNLIEKKGHNYTLTDEIYNYDCGNKIEEFSRKYGKLLDSFISFAVEQYNEIIAIEKAEEILIGFLKQYDLELLFASYDKSSLPHVEMQKKEIYLFSKYVEHLEAQEPELFKNLVDVAVGHTLSNIMNCGDDFKKLSKPSLDGINLYLDTRFILRLIGAEGILFNNVYSKLVKELNNEGLNLCIFNHTFDEIDGILQNALFFIDAPTYQPLKASPVLRYFKELGYKETDVQLFINKLEATLEKYNIGIKEGPDPNTHIKYQIDEGELESTIIETYQWTDMRVSQKEHVILKDVQSISYIYKFREGNKPHTINQSKYIFVTTNSKLAYASKKFEKSIYGNGFYIPVTVTDIFIGTLIWLRKPEKLIADSERRLIASVYAALNPSDELLKQYINEIDKLKKNEEISEDDYILLRDSQVAKKLLTEETLGDPNRFTPKTPIEILEEIEEKAERKLAKEREEHENTREMLEDDKKRIEEEAKSKLLMERKEHAKTKKMLEDENRKKDKKANQIAWGAAIIMVLIFIPIAILSFFNLYGWMKWVSVAISAIFIIFSILGITVNSIKNKFKAIIIKLLY